MRSWCSFYQLYNLGWVTLTNKIMINLMSPTTYDVSVEQNFLTTFMFKRTETQSDLKFTWVIDIWIGFQWFPDDNRTIWYVFRHNKNPEVGSFNSNVFIQLVFFTWSQYILLIYIWYINTLNFISKWQLSERFTCN